MSLLQGRLSRVETFFAKSVDFDFLQLSTFLTYDVERYENVGLTFLTLFNQPVRANLKKLLIKTFKRINLTRSKGLE